MRGGARLLLAFGVASGAAVAIGALACANSGVPAGLWLRNLGAWALAHPLLTATLAGVITILAFPNLIPEKWRPS